MAKRFKVILVTGARQTGKTTLLKELFPTYQRITFDRHHDIHQARENGDAFLDSISTPAILDEVQFVPELLSCIKRRVDESEKMGQYFLTGSQNLSTIQAAIEGMPGRVGVFDLHHMSLYEAHNISGENSLQNHPWLPTYLKNPETMPRLFAGPLNALNYLEAIWRGNLPRSILSDGNQMFHHSFFSSYYQTYIERDVRLAARFTDIDDFCIFTSLCAGLSGCEINYEQLGREIMIAGKTAKNWISLLKQTYQWRSHHPYFRNTTKRLSKKKKGYFSDTGLACHLLELTTPGDLLHSGHLGHLFETWVVNSVHQQSSLIPANVRMHHWRSNSGAEVDLLIQHGGTLYPIEVKTASTVSQRDTMGIRALHKAHPTDKIAHGLVIYTGNQCYRINEFATALPWDTLVKNRLL